MPDYRRPEIVGGTYVISQATYQRQPWLCREMGRLGDDTDVAQHCDYIHYNPVHHQLCQVPTDWQFSSVHRLITEGIYPPNWGEGPVEFEPDERSHCHMGEEGFYLRNPQLLGMTLVMKQDVATNPLPVGLLRAAGIMLEPNSLSNPVE